MGDQTTGVDCLVPDTDVTNLHYDEFKKKQVEHPIPLNDGSLPKGLSLIMLT